MSQTRRLAAILAADVAGYSRLMGADEEGTLERLKALRRELLDPRIAEHYGRIVKTTGDGLLVEFASVVDAVLDRFFPDLEFRFISSPPHPFRLVRRRLPGIPSFAAELAVQLHRPSTEAIRALFAGTHIRGHGLGGSRNVVRH